MTTDARREAQDKAPGSSDTRAPGGEVGLRTAGVADSPAALVTSGFAKVRRMAGAIPTWMISVVGGFLLWELAVRIWEPSPLVIVGPTTIWDEFLQLLENGTLWHHFSVSMRAFGSGYLLAAAVGIPLGLVMGASRMVRAYLDPWVSALYATPSISLAPLFIVWLGFGLSSKMAIVAMSAFFPVIINTTAGVLAVDKDLREVGMAFRANRRETFVRILLPGSMPYIVAGLRLAIGRGLVGVVVADLFGSTAGLGFLLLNAAQVFNTARIFVATIILALLGVVLSSLLLAVERRLAPWRVDEVTGARR